jgi:uncharacterized phage-associated protein
MAYHYIAIMSSYSEGYRLGWHYSSEEKLDKKVIVDFIERVEDAYGDLPLGIHKLTTGSTHWSSVVEKDSFFKDVIITPEVDKFIEVATQDKELKPSDVARFILSILPVSHLKLQKLLYFAYAEYLLKTSKKLFEEPIVAFKYGPVVESVFYQYKSHGSSIIDFAEDESFRIDADEVTVTPSLMKIVSSEHSIEAAKIIYDSIVKYGDMSAGELVDLTHVENGPWHRVYRIGRNSEIKDELIIRYHHLLEQ